MATFQPLTLSDAERSELQTFVRRGQASARILTRARILLKLGDGWRDAQAMEAFSVCRETVYRVRERYLAGGLSAVLRDQHQTHRRRALSDAQATHLIALACTPAPEGHDHWTLRLLAGKAVELAYVTSISPETIRAVLKKTRSSPGKSKRGVSPAS